MDPETYCRDIEAYLCRKNDGHLIRIVGPSFERVCGWAERGIPIKVAFRGIDRLFERYYAKGPRRRPVRIDFCEADVLDVYDEWRRAVGVGASPASAPERAGETEPEDAISARRPTLPAHLDRVIARLTSLRAGPAASSALDELLDRIVRELDQIRASAKGVRGGARAQALARLEALDREIVAAARARLDAAALDAVRREAAEELAPFRGRMTPEAYERALEACTERLIRERARLPTIAM